MKTKLSCSQIVTFIAIAAAILGCTSARMEIATVTVPQASTSSKPTGYEFPDAIDVSKQYLFYLHGKIIEDQGIPAISPVFGEYEYEAILGRFRGYGFAVISEQRSKNTDAWEYARKVVEEVTALLKAGVPANSITVVGASKGAGITIFASHLLENEETNFVILAICHPDHIEDLIRDQIDLYGNVLSVYDSADALAGSCGELFSFSGDSVSHYDEIILNIGSGHGILYQPLDAWMLPTVQWANDHAE